MKLYQANSWAYNAVTNNTYFDDDNRIVYKTITPFKFKNSTTTITKTRESERESPGAIFQPEANQKDQPTQVEEYDLVELHSDTSGLRRRKSDPDAASTTSSIDMDAKTPIGWDEDANDSQTLVNESIAGPSTTTLAPLSPGSMQTFEYIAQIDWRVFASSILRFSDGGHVEVKEFFRKEGWGPYGRHRVFTAKDGREYKWYLRYWYSELTRNDDSKTPVARFHRKALKSLIPGVKTPPAHLEILPAGEHMVDEIFVTFVYIEKLRKEKERAARPKGGGGP